jgi:hypothetical protein
LVRGGSEGSRGETGGGNIGGAALYHELYRAARGLDGKVARDL